MINAELKTGSKNGNGSTFEIQLKYTVILAAENGEDFIAKLSSGKLPSFNI